MGGPRWGPVIGKKKIIVAVLARDLVCYSPGTICVVAGELANCVQLRPTVWWW